MVLLCFICWAVNPILLRYRYESVRERTRNIMKTDFENNKLLSLKAGERAIKSHIVRFHRIEFGKNI